MVGYFIFIFVMIVLIVFAEFTRRKGLYNLTVHREVSKNGIEIGEELKITTVVENNKWLPISFLLVEEKMPINIEYYKEADCSSSGKYFYHISKFSIKWHERIKKSYVVKINRRGIYSLRDISVTVGDIFGFSSEKMALEDYIEIVVYPSLTNINKFEFQSTNMQGENIINRWIYKDPLFIKGIREYNVEDRMKDIHWKSSLKMNKLMVKDYDYTSEREVIIIENIQCAENHWFFIDEQAIENGIKIGVSLAQKAIKEGVSTGLWTNAQIISYYKDNKTEVKPSLNSIKEIMELCARMDYTPRVKFDEYLVEKSKAFTQSCTYIMITPYLSEESINLILKLRRHGFLIKLIDVSTKQDVPYIEGIEKICYKGEF